MKIRMASGLVLFSSAVLMAAELPDVMSMFGKSWASDQSVLEPEALRVERRFEDRGFIFAFNANEICDLRIPADADILSYSDFLFDEPFRRFLDDKIHKDENPMSIGEMKAFEEVYRAQVKALEVMVSLGYQALMFHNNINATNAAVKIRNARFSDGTLFQNAAQAFFDNYSPLKDRILAWGDNFVDAFNEDDLQNIISGGDPEAVEMKWPALNSRYYVHEHMGGYHKENSVKHETSVQLRFSNWREIHKEVGRRIRNLRELKLCVADYRDKVENFSTDSKLASDPRFANVKERFLGLKFDEIYDKQNLEAVRAAREIFYDVPFLVAVKEFHNDVDANVHSAVLGGNDRPGMLTALSSLKPALGNEDAFMRGSKSRYPYKLYLKEYDWARKQYQGSGGLFGGTTAATQQKQLMEFDDKSKSLGLKMLEKESASNLGVAMGAFLWEDNVLCDISSADKYTAFLIIGKDSWQEINFTYLSGESITLDAPPPRPGYTFDGWYDGMVKHDTLKGVRDNIKLVARWTTQQLTAKFFNNGSVFDTVSFTVETAKDIILPSIPDNTIPGYKFKGWKKGGKSINSLDGVTTDLHLEADWDPIIYSVKLMDESGKEYLPVDFVGANSGVIKNFSVNSDHSLPTPKAPSEGKTFQGWFDDSGRRILSLDRIYNDVKLHSKFDWTEFTVTFKTGTFDWQERNRSFTISNAAGITLPTPPAGAKKGYNFLGWENEKTGDTITSLKGLKSSIVLKAKWDLIEYKLEYFDGTKSIPDLNRKFDVNNMANIQLPRLQESEDRIFTGWTTDVNGGVSVTSFMRLIQDSPRDVKLYAKWKPILHYKIKFIDGDEKPGLETDYTEANVNGVRLPVLQNTADKKFLGWKDESGINVRTVSSVNNFPRNITLYAVWEDISAAVPPAPVTPSVEYKQEPRQQPQQATQVAAPQQPQHSEDYGYCPKCNIRPPEESKNWKKFQWAKWFKDHPEANNK